MQWQTKLPLIAILRGITPDEALAHVGAVIDAGFDAVEIPLNSPQWEQSIPAIVDAYGDKALIGAGTVLKPEQVDALARQCFAQGGDLRILLKVGGYDAAEGAVFRPELSGKGLQPVAAAGGQNETEAQPGIAAGKLPPDAGRSTGDPDSFG